MTPEEELHYVREQLRSHKVCIALMIEQIIGVCNGSITVKQLIIFKNEMDKEIERIIQ